MKKKQEKIRKKGIHYKTYLKLNHEIKLLAKQIRLLDKLGAIKLPDEYNKKREKQRKRRS